MDGQKETQPERERGEREYFRNTNKEQGWVSNGWVGVASVLNKYSEKQKKYLISQTSKNAQHVCFFLKGT